MHREDRLYFQLMIGIVLGIILGIGAFFQFTNCTVGSLCKAADAANILPPPSRDSHTKRIMSQIAQSDQPPIVVEWTPYIQAAVEQQPNHDFILDGVLPTGHALSSVPDSFSMAVDAGTLDYLIGSNATFEEVPLNWGARDWMIVTGSYNLLTVADPEVGHDMQLFFQGDEFRTVIVGYDSAEAANIDLVKIRTDLRTSAQNQR